MSLTQETIADANRALAGLVGLPLSDMWRYLGCQKFEFGEQKPHFNGKGEETTWADWGLVANCTWCIDGPNGFVLCSHHFGPTPARRDDHTDPFYELFNTDPPVVEAVEMLDHGALRFQMSGSYSIALDPEPPDEDHFEDWRVMPPAEDPRGHLVLGEDRLEWSGSPAEALTEADTP